MKGGWEGTPSRGWGHRHRGFAQPTRQLGDIHRNPSRFILAKQLRRRSSPRLILEIDICELLAVHDKAGGQFLDRRLALHCHIAKLILLI
jgi:hypothetical protein